MSIKLIAVDLYRAQKAVWKLEKELEEATLKDKEAIKRKLRQAQAEWQQLRNIMDGEKRPSVFRKKPHIL